MKLGVLLFGPESNRQHSRLAKPNNCRSTTNNVVKLP